MDEKKIMIIGRSHGGKTTLIEHLVYGKSKSRKTQSIERIANFIDTPGEYLEIPHYYKALLITSYDADLIIMLEEATEEHSLYPPKFSSAFQKPVIGVITKVDQGGDVEKIKKNLKRAGAEKIFVIDYRKPETLNKLKEYLEQTLPV
ncbi:MAG: EutP/PduV family microcompartment system protein [Tissierellia bacterium]|nr:EutP/PduV family microcompartment system protein [Tissierellia bacterium]